jgi:site-specific DNA-methyltransferase (cytosine-N4-specific)
MNTNSSTPFHLTSYGGIYCADSLDFMQNNMEKETTALIFTSPPFALLRKKAYGNVDAAQYLDWFRPFAVAFKRLLKPDGSLVIDIGGSWIRGQPTRSLYHFELLIMLCQEFGFHLAQEFFWWNPAKLPSPAEWVTVRRIRVKDAVNCLWWLSLSPWPKASNRRVLQPYSNSMRALMVKGHRPKIRPSGHDISDRFGIHHSGSIPPNLISLAHTESNSKYQRFCRAHKLKPHPARFPSELPEFFIHMLTDQNDLVFDPFAGSCATGEAAERTKRLWICCDLHEAYLKGALGRFPAGQGMPERLPQSKAAEESYYRAYRPGALWNGTQKEAPLESGKGSELRRQPRQVSGRS